MIKAFSLWIFVVFSILENGGFLSDLMEIIDYLKF
jgi:hypothetical protein